jgi:hypothetical protein
VTESRILAADSRNDPEPLTEPTSVRTRTRGSRQAPLSLGDTWAAMLLLLVLCGSVLTASGVGVLQTSRILVVLVVQVATGATLWRLARGATASHTAELVGMGLALGTLTALISAQVLLSTPLAGVAWLLPTVGVAAALAVPRVRRRFRSGSTTPVSLDEVGTVALGIGTGLMFAWSFWRQQPLRWHGWWRYYVDIPVHEARATSLATWGPTDNILVAGKPIRYHWFTYAWAGMTTNASDAGSFVVVTRIMPLVALVGTICLVWAWSRRLSKLRSVPFLAVVVATLGMDVGSQLPFSYLTNFTVSPSMGVSALWLLGASLVLTEHLAGRLDRPEPLLFLLTVGCVGGKITDAVVLVGGAGMAALVSLVFRSAWKKAWIDLVVVVVAAAAAFLVVIWGSEGNLGLEFGSSARTYSFLHDSGSIGMAIGTLAVALAIVAKWSGVAFLFARSKTRHRPEAWFAVGAAGTGLFLMTVLGHPAAGQLYFPMSASVVVTVVSGWGLGMALRYLSARTLMVCVFVGIGSGLAAFASRSGFVTARTAQDQWLWLAPVAVWLLTATLVAAVLVYRKAVGSRGPLVVGVAVAVWSLIAASLTFGSVTLSDTVRQGRPAAPAANSSLAFTRAHVKALVWLRDHSATDDIVATNRQCSAPQIGAAPCAQARWFLTAAISHRRMLIEGTDYALALKALPAWASDRVGLSRRFVDQPREADAVALWTAGVRWVVVDLASTHTRTWSPYARSAFSTRTTVILRLNKPGP